MKPGLTVAVVFRNGEAILLRCLESVKNIATELVAVDTGCTDNCREIAKSFGARVIDFPWIDSFDEAYNFAFDKVETEWTFWLDSDEWFVASSRSILEKAMQYEPGFAYTVIREDELDETRVSEMRQPRLWRTHPKMRVEGVIHSQFPRQALLEASRGRKLIHSEIRIRHDGFKGGISREKLERNLKLLEKEIALRPGNLYFEISYCENLLLLGDPKGVELLNTLLPKAFSSNRTPDEISGGLLAAGLRVGLPNGFTLESAFDLGLKHFFRSPNVMWELTNACVRAGQIEASLIPLENLWKMARSKDYSKHGLSDPDILGKSLGDLMLAIGNRLGNSELVTRSQELLSE